MADSTPPADTPRHHGSDFDDNHYHDEDEVAPLPSDDEGIARPRNAPTKRPSRKLPPPKRRFHED